MKTEKKFQEKSFNSWTVNIFHFQSKGFCHFFFINLILFIFLSEFFSFPLFRHRNEGFGILKGMQAIRLDNFKISPSFLDRLPKRKKQKKNMSLIETNK